MHWESGLFLTPYLFVKQIQDDIDIYSEIEVGHESDPYHNHGIGYDRQRVILCDFDDELWIKNMYLSIFKDVLWR